MLPAGPPVRSSSRPALVRAERSALGERLVVEGTLGTMSFTQVVTLLAGSSRVGLRLYLHGFSGPDQLVRLRFPTALRGGTPLAEVANAVVARSFALLDADSAVAPWTLDSPAQGWFGLGPTLSVQSREAPSGRPAGSRALGVAEVVTSAGAGAAPEVRELMVALVGKGVTASCAEASANRYGGLLGDSNLPDFRVSIGAANENELTATVVESAGQGYVEELSRQLAAAGRARLWVPASCAPEHRWVPGADVRGARDLPVLVVAGVDKASTTAAVLSLAEDVRIRAAGRRAACRSAERLEPLGGDHQGQVSRARQGRHGRRGPRARAVRSRLDRRGAQPGHTGLRSRRGWCPLLLAPAFLHRVALRRVDRPAAANSP